MNYTIKNSVVISGNCLEVNSKPIFFTEQKFSAELFLKAVYEFLGINYPKFFKMDILSKLGFLAAEVILSKEELSLEERESLGILLYNTSSSLETDTHFQETINSENGFFPSPSVFVYTLPNIVIGEISIRHKLYGENRLMIVDEYQLDKILEDSYIIMKANKLNKSLVGYVDAYQDSYFAHFIFLSDN